MKSLSILLRIPSFFLETAHSAIMKISSQTHNECKGNLIFINIYILYVYVYIHIYYILYIIYIYIYVYIYIWYVVFLHVTAFFPNHFNFLTLTKELPFGSRTRDKICQYLRENISFPLFSFSMLTSRPFFRVSKRQRLSESQISTLK